MNNDSEPSSDSSGFKRRRKQNSGPVGRFERDDQKLVSNNPPRKGNGGRKPKFKSNDKSKAKPPPFVKSSLGHYHGIDDRMEIIIRTLAKPRVYVPWVWQPVADAMTVLHETICSVETTFKYSCPLSLFLYGIGQMFHARMVSACKASGLGLPGRAKSMPFILDCEVPIAVVQLLQSVGLHDSRLRETRYLLEMPAVQNNSEVKKVGTGVPFHLLLDRTRAAVFIEDEDGKVDMEDEAGEPVLEKPQKPDRGSMSLPAYKTAMLEYANTLEKYLETVETRQLTRGFGVLNVADSSLSVDKVNEVNQTFSCTGFHQQVWDMFDSAMSRLCSRVKSGKVDDKDVSVSAWFVHRKTSDQSVDFGLHEVDSHAIVHACFYPIGLWDGPFAKRASIREGVVPTNQRKFYFSSVD